MSQTIARALHDDGLAVRAVDMYDGRGLIVSRPMTPSERDFWRRHGKPRAEAVYCAFFIDPNLSEPAAVQDCRRAVNYALAQYKPEDELDEA